MTSLNSLPFDILEEVFRHVPKTVSQLHCLRSVNRRFNSIPIKKRYWYDSLIATHSALGKHVNYEDIDDASRWQNKAEILHRTKKQLESFNVSTSSSIPPINTSLQSTCSWQEDPFKGRGKLVSDVDRITNTGVTGVVEFSLHPETGYKSTILLSEYPSGNIVKEFTFNSLCQLCNIQTIWIHTEKGVEKMRFFTLAVGKPIDTKGTLSPERLLVYRLFENNDIQCVAHLQLNDTVLSSDVFLISQASWKTYCDGESYGRPNENLEDWLNVVAPEQVGFVPQHTLIAIAFVSVDRAKQTRRRRFQGKEPDFQTIPFRIDLQRNDVFDPLLVHGTWDSVGKAFNMYQDNTTTAVEYPGLSAAWEITYGEKRLDATTATHIRYPPQLNHLVVEKKWDGGVHFYDWRYGVHVGTLSHMSFDREYRTFSVRTEPIDQEENEYGLWQVEDATTSDHRFEYEIMSLLPWDSKENLNDIDALKKHRLHLVTLDYILGQVEVKSWDITYMLDVEWRPLDRQFENVSITRSLRYPWWDRGSPQLKTIASGVHDKCLPYSPPDGFQAMLIDHYFNIKEASGTVHIQAYKVVGTCLAILTQASELIAIDLESGCVLRRLNLQTVSTGFKGINIDVLCTKNIIISGHDTVLSGALL